MALLNLPLDWGQKMQREVLGKISKMVAYSKIFR
jgi:hypothetical protein